MSKYFSLLIIVSFVFAFCNNRKPIKIVQINTTGIAKDLVPDDATAIKIAEAIWLPIYGSKIYDEKPYVATLRDSVWIVEGTLPKYLAGGTAYIEIQKKDCRILKVTHFK